MYRIRVLRLLFLVLKFGQAFFGLVICYKVTFLVPEMLRSFFGCQVWEKVGQ